MGRQVSRDLERVDRDRRDDAQVAKDIGTSRSLGLRLYVLPEGKLATTLALAARGSTAQAAAAVDEKLALLAGIRLAMRVPGRVRTS